MPHGPSRREFLGSLAAFALFPLEQEKPELILYNANILTMNGTEPRAQAVAIAGGRFLAVGSNSDVLNLAGPGARKLDLTGKTIVPGFIDAHSHPADAGRLHLRMVDCDLRSIREILAALRERAAKTPPGDWVLGFKYDDTKTEEGRPLTIADLDAVPTIPCTSSTAAGTRLTRIRRPSAKPASTKKRPIRRAERSTTIRQPENSAAAWRKAPTAISRRSFR